MNGACELGLSAVLPVGGSPLSPSPGGSRRGPRALLGQR